MDERDIEVPASVKLFRKILNHVKRNLLDKQYDENADNDDIQNIRKLKETVDRIQQFGNVVLSLFKDLETDTREHKSVKNLFQKYEFVIPDSNAPEHKLCIYYLKNDVFLYPYDLNPSHIDSL